MDNLAYKMQAMCISNRSRTSIHDKVRVCFYGRVSTQHEEQVNALSNQLQWYETILAEHPNWEKVNVYVDKGVTGTQAKKREGFMQMIKDAEKGDFDLICTREVSRFARNTVDSLQYTRQLREWGVEVFFYNDGIWSLEQDGELRLTIMSAMAQEESKHISERVRAGQRISREKGVLYGNGNILGYRLIKGKKSIDNTYEIIEEEAETVRMIYDLYLTGMGAKTIAGKMVEMKRKKADGTYNWEHLSVLRILNNKTYAGYISYNKSYTKNFLGHKRVTVRDVSQYEYVKGNFPAIVSEETWNRVQAIKSKKVVSLIVLSHTVVFGVHYFPMLFTNPAAMPTRQMIAAIVTIILLAMLIPLFITSFKSVRRKMNGKTWKNIQRMAYPFFIGIYVHIMVLYSADVKSHMTGIIVYTVIYACYVILRLRKAALKSRKAKIATA